MNFYSVSPKIGITVRGHEHVSCNTAKESVLLNSNTALIQKKPTQKENI